MSQYGVHVPEGQPAFSIDDVKSAADKLADAKGEVGLMRVRGPKMQVDGPLRA